jgi:hypothetical protein
LVSISEDVRVGEILTVGVYLQNNPGTVKAIHFVLPYDPSRLEFIGVDKSDELAGDLYPVFFDGRDVDHHVDVSLALLGGKASIGGSGEIAGLTFRLLEGGNQSLSFSLVDLRDGENTTLSSDDQDADGYEVVSLVPSGYDLDQSYPNPFNPETVIAYQLPSGGHVSLKIYNITGQLVRTLVDGHMPAGNHSVVWDSRDAHDNSVASGMYLYRLEASDYSSTRKMILLK